jgi:NADH-quinone oxidoreductase subunit G
MPRPPQRMVTFSIDGLEVTAPENIMLVDGAKYGDVEIPVFCYEPKLGAPVGACRMCLVEIEGIPKLQTACSTPVKDGMVVHTQTDRVREAQEAVVEFLLVNHPLDCPVCDKGGECPLQDISFGWGGGRSRFIEPKRHFVKPLALSPLIAIDRERCILCYRCVRFSQEISEDYQLILQERGAHSYVATFDGHPYVAPFSGNIVELCPVGALTSQPYRFRSARRSATSASPSATSASCASWAATTPRSTTAGSATRAGSPTRPSTSRSASPSRWSATAACCARCRGSAR